MKPEIHIIVADPVHSFLRVLPAARLKRYHLLDDIKYRQILHIDADLGARKSGRSVQIIQLVLPGRNLRQDGLIDRQFPQTLPHQVFRCMVQIAARRKNQSADIGL